MRRSEASMLAASKADLLVFGKGEATIVALARRLAAGEPATALRDLRGVAYLLGAKETLPAWPGRTLRLPSLEEVSRDRTAFARMPSSSDGNLSVRPGHA